MTVMAAALLLSACSVTEPTDDTVYGEGLCSGRGTGPHHVTGTLRIGTHPHEAVLMIGPGSVVFTANSRSDRWSGIEINEYHRRPQPHGCNLEDNGGSGIHNESAAVADATGNWWGDPGGPLAPGGDGVLPNVDYSPFLVAPRPDPAIAASSGS